MLTTHEYFFFSASLVRQCYVNWVVASEEMNNQGGIAGVGMADMNEIETIF